jgi:hypothetical protein
VTERERDLGGGHRIIGGSEAADAEATERLARGWGWSDRRRPGRPRRLLTPYEILAAWDAWRRYGTRPTKQEVAELLGCSVKTLNRDLDRLKRPWPPEDWRI